MSQYLKQQGGERIKNKLMPRTGAILFATGLLLSACGSTTVEAKTISPTPSPTKTTQKTSTSVSSPESSSITNKPNINLCTLTQLTTLAETILNGASVQCATTSVNMSPSCDMAVWYDPSSGNQDTSLNQIDLCFRNNINPTTDVWGQAGNLYLHDLNGAQNPSNKENIVNNAINGNQAITAIRYIQALNSYTSAAETVIGGQNGVLGFTDINSQSPANDTTSTSVEFLQQAINLTFQG